MKSESVEQPVRFAVVGCGSLARAQHIPNLAASPSTVLHTCCDVSDEALAECRERFGAERVTRDFEQAVNDPDVEAVCLATTEKLRLPVIEAAAAAGKPVYVEKPLARTLEEMYRIQKVVHEAGIPFCVGHNRRSAPAMLEAHRIFRQHMTAPQPCAWRWEREAEHRPQLEHDGVAGMAVRVNDDWHSWKSWVFDPEQAPHGPMLFEMTHFTDLCNWLLDAEPETVVALETPPLNHIVSIQYRTGEMASISMFANGTFGYPKELYELFGNGGAVAIDHMLEIRTAGIAEAPMRKTFPMRNDRHPDLGAEGGMLGWLAKRHRACEEAADAGDPTLQFTGDPDKGHARQMDRFVDEIRGRGPVVCGVDDAILATRVAFAAIMSVQRRQPVGVDEL